MGLGKEQPHSATVYTPNGPSTMGQIEVGDLVIGRDGTRKKVLAIHPQGLKKVYRVTFTDGSATRCGIDHLWSVQTPGQKHRGADYKVKKLSELIGDLHYSNGNHKWQIPMTEAVDFIAKPIEIPAYTLGVMIGDGSLNHASISVTNKSKYIYERLKTEMFSFSSIELRRFEVKKDNTFKINFSLKTVGGRNPVKKIIQKLNLNVTSAYKFIPDLYKYNSISTRVKILNGLLDTDGYVAKDGTVQYTSASKKLVEDVIEVVQSLGGTATINYKLTNISTDAWTATLKIPNNFLHAVITKPEKRGRARPLIKYEACRYISSIERIGHEESKCLTVEGEHYLTDQYIVTHNTLSTLWLARKQIHKLRAQGVNNPKFMVIVPKSAMPTWKVECAKHTPDILSNMILAPYSQLHHILNRVKYADIRLIAFDESHYLKSPDTQRIGNLADLLEKIGTINGCFAQGKILTLSGTPMPNGAHELYTTWCICCAPNLLEAAKWLRDMTKFNEWKTAFSQKKERQFERYNPKTQRREVDSGSSHDGVANEDKLNVILREFVHFRRVSDCIDLPESTPNYIDLNLPDDRLLKDANIDEPEAYMALLERLARAKAPYMFDWVRDFIHAGEEQLIVFSNYTTPLRELQTKFPKFVRVLTGAEDDRTRAKNLKDFQEGKFRVYAMSFKCGSESLNLQNCAHSLYHGYPWTAGLLNQAMARTKRSGQQRATFHHFLTSGENDQKILNIVKRKQKATTTVEDLLLGNISGPVSLDGLI